MDLVAHLLFTTLGLNDELGVSPDDCVLPDFRLKLFVSFPSRKNSVGLELLEAISEYFNEILNSSFELIVRFSKEEYGSMRWDKEFIKRELQEASRQDLKKVWICGTP